MKNHHGNKWMPVMYAIYYGIFKDIAKKYGYAIAIHGSLQRDMDLIAVPWVEHPKSHLDMFREFLKTIGEEGYKDKPYSSVGVKPHGRIAYTIPTGSGGYVDVSVINSTEKPNEQFPIYNRLTRDRAERRDVIKNWIAENKIDIQKALDDNSVMDLARKAQGVIYSPRTALVDINRSLTNYFCKILNARKDG